MNTELTLAMKLQADASRMVSGLLNGERGIKKFTSTAKREFESVKNSVTSLEGKMASLGVTIGVTASIMQSARLDKSLTQIGQTAGAAESEVSGLRKELFTMAQETGQSVDDLKDGFNNAVQSGLRFNEALPVIDATNKAMAVTNASADRLTSSLTVASTAYSFDLKKPRQALTILDQMTAAGRLGNAELENLSDIFGRVGPGAASAGMGFTQTLAFIEGLSQIERQPERLATLADSTLRLFNNLNYMKDAQKATKVKFFDADGSRRDALEVIADIKKEYDKLDTEKDRALYIQKAFGKADLDTIKGMRILLSGEMLNTINGFGKRIEQAGGTLERDLQNSISNAVDQVGRLKGAFREAADNFAQPINETIANVIKWTMDKKANGGLGMDGQDMLMASGGGALATILAAKFGSKAISGIAGKLGGIGAGVATGKALETAAGVTPVYVVNMGEGGMGNGLSTAAQIGTSTVAGGAGAFALKNLKTTFALLGGSNLASLRMMGGAAMGTAGLGVTAAGATGYGVGTLLNKGFNAIDNKFNTGIGDAIARTVAVALLPFSENARNALMSEIKPKATELMGKIELFFNESGKLTAKMTTNQSGMKINMANGPYMVGH
jgi:TP901 family phage tail tape measure protein